MEKEQNLFKPDVTISVIKGMPVKGNHLIYFSEDQTIDLKDTKQYECNE